jgi:putative membrane protein
MKTNLISKRAGCTASTWAIAALLATGTAIAQAGGMGGTQQSQPAGSAQPGAMNSTTAPGAMTGMPMDQASMQDKDFLREAGQGGMFEIQAGQLASQKGNSADVKQFGQMMVTDHTQLNTKMQPVFSAAGVKPPTSLSGKDKKELATLQGLSGDAFDQAYITCMLKDHKADKKAFQSEAINGQLSVEKNAATQGESVIDKHLQAITQIAQAHNLSAGM